MPSKKLTISEVDVLLQNVQAKHLSAVLTIPDPGCLQFDKRQTQLTLGHLSDERVGLHVRESEYNATLGQEFYPMALTKMPLGIATTVLRAGDPAQPIAQPGDLTYEDEIQVIYVQANVFGANRQISINLFDGLGTIPIYDSGAGAWVSGAGFQVWPVDMSTYMTGAVEVIGVPPLKVNNTTYLYGIATGLVGAETFTISIGVIALPIGTGLRQ